MTNCPKSSMDSKKTAHLVQSVYTGKLLLDLRHVLEADGQ